FERVGDVGGQAATLNNIGSVHSALGDKQQALEYYQRALKLLHQVGDRFNSVTILLNIGLLLFELDDTKRACQNLSEAHELSKQTNHPSQRKIQQIIETFCK
ncbi:tetratricopeptide repeat protein, partial [bacterium]|nr:tetratricopeptide repeat protein [candidate division CSSED10-310 bacterium]